MRVHRGQYGSPASNSAVRLQVTCQRSTDHLRHLRLFGAWGSRDTTAAIAFPGDATIMSPGRGELRAPEHLRSPPPARSPEVAQVLSGRRGTPASLRRTDA